MIADLWTLYDIIRTAGRQELIPRYNRVGHALKPDGSILTEADLASDRFLRETLSKNWPEINFLSEEMPHQEQQALIDTGKPYWCVDPLDGTSNFAAGVPIFGICIALIENGEPSYGLIYDPLRDECFCAAKGQGAWLNGARLEVKPINFNLRRAIALVDFKRLERELRLKLVDTPPYGSQRNVGSCAMEWAWMAAGRGHIYLHGGQKLWDMAAGYLILQEAGGFSQTLHGETVFRSALTPRSVIASPSEELFEEWSNWLLIEGRQINATRHKQMRLSRA